MRAATAHRIIVNPEEIRLSPGISRKHTLSPIPVRVTRRTAADFLEGGRIAAEGTPAEIFDGRHDGRLGEFLGKVRVGTEFRDKVKSELFDILRDREVSEDELARLKDLLAGNKPEK